MELEGYDCEKCGTFHSFRSGLVHQERYYCVECDDNHFVAEAVKDAQRKTTCSRCGVEDFVDEFAFVNSREETKYVQTRDSVEPVRVRIADAVCKDADACAKRCSVIPST